MGEAKRKRDRMTPAQLAAVELTHKLADEGFLIKAGFVGFMAACFPDEQPSDAQRRELEQAFMGGAVHLFSSMMVFLDSNGTDEPTEKDMRRMELIDKELTEYGKVLEARAATAAKTEGSA